MSGGEKSEKDEGKKKEEAGKEPKPCPHEFCHRDEIESDRPIGLPFASGRLKYLPGQEPDPYNFKQRKILKKKKCMEEKAKEIADIMDACPQITGNVLSNDPEIEDDMQYLFNLVLEVGGDHDVKEYINKFKENLAKANEEAEKKRKAEEEEENKKKAEEEKKKKAEEEEKKKKAEEDKKAKKAEEGEESAPAEESDAAAEEGATTEEGAAGEEGAPAEEGAAAEGEGEGEEPPPE